MPTTTSEDNSVEWYRAPVLAGIIALVLVLLAVAITANVLSPAHLKPVFGCADEYHLVGTGPNTVCQPD